MSTLNRCQMIGTLSENPTAKPLDGGGKVWQCIFATDGNRRKIDGVLTVESMFIEIKVFNRRSGRQLADWCEKNLRRGDLVCLTGRLVLERWTNRDGDNLSKHVIEIEEIWLRPPDREAAA